MLPLGLHSLGWNDPDPLAKIDLIPIRVEHLSRSGSSQDQKFESPCCDSWTFMKFGHEPLDTIEWQGGMMAARRFPPSRQELVQMTSPTRRIFAFTQTVCLGSIKYVLDASSEPVGSLGNPTPMWPQYFENVIGLNFVQQQRPDRRGIDGQRHFPLVDVLRVFPGRRHRLYETIGIFAKGDVPVCLRSFSFGVFTLADHGAILGCLLPRLGQGQGPGTSEAQLLLGTAPGVSEQPAAASGIDKQEQAAAVGVAAWLLDTGNSSGGEAIQGMTGHDLELLFKTPSRHGSKLGVVCRPRIGTLFGTLFCGALKGSGSRLPETPKSCNRQKLNDFLDVLRRCEPA